MSQAASGLDLLYPAGNGVGESGASPEVPRQVSSMIHPTHLEYRQEGQNILRCGTVTGAGWKATVTSEVPSAE